MDDLLERLELLAAWRKPGGKTPKEEMPNTYKTVTDAAARIQALETSLAEALRDRTDARAEAANLRADLRQAEGRVKAITIALHDAIRRPMGVVPESAEPFYQPALASDPLLDRQGDGKEG